MSFCAGVPKFYNTAEPFCTATYFSGKNVSKKGSVVFLKCHQNYEVAL